MHPPALLVRNPARRGPRVCAALVASACAGLLVACAGFPYAPNGVQPGMTEGQALSIMGPPAARHAMPGGGSRLEYPRGPSGQHTYMVDVDVQGRVSGWQQVLTERHFNAITPGMSEAELRRRLGRPMAVRPGGWQPGTVWSYRYESPFCTLWLVSLVEGRVTDAARVPDPRCEAPSDQRS